MKLGNHILPVFFLMLFSFVSNGQDKTIDSLKRVLQTQKEDTNKVKTLFELSYSYSDSHADTGVVYAQQALDLAKKLNFEEGILYAEGTLALSLQIAGNYPLALDHGLKAFSLAKKMKSSAEPWACSLVSYCYYYMDDYPTFLKYTLDDMSSCQPWELPFGWRDLAMAYHQMNQPDSAMLYAKKAYEKLKGSDAEGNVSNVLGDAYAGKASYDSALIFYQSGVFASLNSNIAIDLVDNYNGMAAVYKAKHSFDSASWYSKKVLEEKIETRYPIGLLEAANMLANIYELQSKSDSSLKYLRIALAIKDSLFSREKTMAIQTLAFKEQERQKDNEASKLKYQNRLRIYLLVGGLIALLVIAGILLRSNRNKQKAKTNIEKAYSELKATQQQLVQSEKMASLGELTAGIAHEIQNPLNFVNNFSEVNDELLRELNAEADKGNMAEVKAIAKDIAFNSGKINHHGKRADSIVKGMLQHSRSSTGQKEPTDINALADEYLRLAYHGFRAKDKSFNATTKTEFDNSIGKIKVNPQDIGRVVLNLINNAFYAVNEKQKAKSSMPNAEGYEPTITVTTAKHNGKVEIRVKDNGNGIPQKILDKIFQPFFTTKPTGQGTGLGLSLAYDIVTKGHGGELKVETKEGEGSSFIIQLPFN